MSLKRTVLLAGIIWIALMTLLHLELNLKIHPFRKNEAARAHEKYRVGFLPSLAI
jgi:hypothetical protein